MQFRFTNAQQQVLIYLFPLLHTFSVSAAAAQPKEVALPRSIADIPERLLLAGIYLPGNDRVKKGP